MHLRNINGMKRDNVAEEIDIRRRLPNPPAFVLQDGYNDLWMCQRSEGSTWIPLSSYRNVYDIDVVYFCFSPPS